MDLALEEAGRMRALAQYLGAPREAETDLALLKEWWEAADSDSQAFCPKEIIPPGW